MEAQSINLFGKIVDEKTNKPLENVVIKSANTTVIGNLDGEFNIDVEKLPVVLTFTTFQLFQMSTIFSCFNFSTFQLISTFQHYN